MTRSAQTKPAIGRRACPEIVAHRASEPPRGWLSWLTTTDHKRIGLMYLIATFGFFLLGGSEALLLRLQLGSPNNTLISSDKYNAVMTITARRWCSSSSCRCGYAPTPNGWKISIMLEELGLPYQVIPVNIRAGEQFRPEFLAISPNNRIPAIVDRAPSDGGEPIPVFETGAILIYLADKTGRFLPKETRARSRVMGWLMWQMSGLGPMLGQHGHFALYAAEKIPYAIERYRDEAARLYRVLDTQLGKTGAYVAGDYSIADIACFPWTMTHKAQGFTLDDYPNVKRWYADVRARPQVQAGLAIGKFVKEPFDDEARRNMFGARAKEMESANPQW